MANKGQTAIIGSGLIGTSWAVIFSKAGYDVVMYDSDEAALGRAKDRAQAQTSALAAQDLLPADAKVDEILGRISYTSSLKDAIQNAFYIQECTPEVLDIKKQVFKQLDPFLGPDCIVGSSTSFMPCSKFTEDIQGRDRCMVCHPVNPPFAVPLVEVVPSEWTRQDLVQKAIQFLQQVGMQPIQVKREIDGFVLNRLQYALLAEAYRLVEDGVASPEDVDKCIKYGLGRRWSFMGPFETIDLNAPGGVQDYCNRYTSGILRVVKTQDNNREWKQSTIDEIERDLRKTTPQDGLGDRCQWRDNRLLALEGHFRQQPQGPPRGEE